MTTPRPDATCRCGHAYDRHHGVADSDFRGHVECMGQAGSDPCDCTGYAPTLPRPGFGDAVPEAKRQRSDALTAESLALLEAVRAAVLDPAIAKMLAPDGRPQLVALVSIALLEHDLPRIEAAARKPLEERIAALEAALSTCGDYIVGLGLPCGTRLVWETEYLALLDLIDRLVTKPHGWLAALASPATEEVEP